MDVCRSQRVLLFARRYASRHNPGRRDRRKCLLRRTAPQSALYLRTDFALRDLSQYACRSLKVARRNKRKTIRRGAVSSRLVAKSSMKRSGDKSADIIVNASDAHHGGLLV